MAVSAAPAAPAGAAPDPFDPGRFRVSQDLMTAAGVKKLLVTLPVQKPSKEWFVRCCPDPAYHITTCVVELKEDAETYLVDPDLWPVLVGESTFSTRMLIPTQDRQGTLFLWPLRLPGGDGRQDEWGRSALEAAAHAQRNWVRVSANMSLGAYEVFAASAHLPDAEWDLPPLGQLLRVAFKDRFYIDGPDHPVLRRLRGEA
ncbi:MAG: hypothetical protein C0501_29600 [Isosphaera sp.]|nr:hypothetical protein [Isosphaera sp.]